MLTMAIEIYICQYQKDNVNLYFNYFKIWFMSFNFDLFIIICKCLLKISKLFILSFFFYFTGFLSLYLHWNHPPCGKNADPTQGNASSPDLVRTRHIRVLQRHHHRPDDVIPWRPRLLCHHPSLPTRPHRLWESQQGGRLQEQRVGLHCGRGKVGHPGALGASGHGGVWRAWQVLCRDILVSVLSRLQGNFIKKICYESFFKIFFLDPLWFFHLPFLSHE